MMWKVLYLSEIVDHETMLQNNSIPIKILSYVMYMKLLPIKITSGSLN